MNRSCRIALNSLLAGSVLLFLAFACMDRREATTVGAERWIFEGWACEPDLAKAKSGLGPYQYCSDDGPKEYFYAPFSPSPGQDTAEDRTKTISVCVASAESVLAERGFVEGALVPLLEDYWSNIGGPPYLSQGFRRRWERRFHSVELYGCCLASADTGYCDQGAASGNATGAFCKCVVSARLAGGQKFFESAVEREGHE